MSKRNKKKTPFNKDQNEFLAAINDPIWKTPEMKEAVEHLANWIARNIDEAALKEHAKQG